ncbi:hypothetical protein MST16_10810 [Acinetobacter sp. YH16040_T]|jgi:hypothetical protein|nr:MULTISPECIES: hypothetical protein [unclassified Acinetobacter]UUS56575.1 hypothetical protein MST16_10810 [Acinetobacter sp. YH16040_T]
MITQIHNNPREQALLGEFDTALETLSWHSNAAYGANDTAYEQFNKARLKEKRVSL